MPETSSCRPAYRSNLHATRGKQLRARFSRPIFSVLKYDLQAGDYPVLHRLKLDKLREARFHEALPWLASWRWVGKFRISRSSEIYANLRILSTPFNNSFDIIVLFVETPRKFITAKLSIRKPGSSSVLIIWWRSGLTDRKLCSNKFPWCFFITICEFVLSVSQDRLLLLKGRSAQFF